MSTNDLQQMPFQYQNIERKSIKLKTEGYSLDIRAQILLFIEGSFKSLV